MYCHIPWNDKFTKLLTSHQFGDAPQNYYNHWTGCLWSNIADGSMIRWSNYWADIWPVVFILLWTRDADRKPQMKLLPSLETIDQIWNSWQSYMWTSGSTKTLIWPSIYSIQASATPATERKRRKQFHYDPIRQVPEDSVWGQMPKVSPALIYNILVSYVYGDYELVRS